MKKRVTGIAQCMLKKECGSASVKEALKGFEGGNDGMLHTIWGIARVGCNKFENELETYIGLTDYTIRLRGALLRPSV